MAKTNEQDMLAIAQSAIAMAKSGGAKDAFARTYRVREVSLDWRDGKPEKISEATTRGVTVGVFVDGRYSSASTSDLRPDALKTFIGDTIALAKAVAPDPFRALPDPELYKGQSNADLKLEDPKYAAVTADQGKKLAKVAAEAARGVKGSEAILSVSSSFGSNLVETFYVTSNGFSGATRGTSYSISSGVSVKDSDGRRPEDYAYASARHISELEDPAAIGRLAAQRAISRLGSKKGETSATMVAIDNRAGGRLIGFLGAAMSAAALQQKRSFLEGKLDQPITAALLTLSDDPLLPKGFASRKYDGEGIAAKPRMIIENGVLKTFFVDTYYGRKLKMAPTTGNPSNLAWKLGGKSQKQLLAEMKDGVLITGFNGGNSNGGTGDFSVGISGYRVRNGEIAEPIAEMNVSGNHLEFWKKLVAIGNDPFPYSSMRTPTLIFENVSVAGT